VITVNLCITNPWSDRFELLGSWGGRILANWAWQFEIYRCDTLAEIELRATQGQDHAGVTLGLGLASWALRAQIYDVRHWDQATSQWDIL
jgi:hypothetical protein